MMKTPHPPFWAGPVLIGIGVGILAGIATVSLLDGVITAVCASVLLAFVEARPFARSIRQRTLTHWRGVGDIVTDSGHLPSDPTPSRRAFAAGSTLDNR